MNPRRSTMWLAVALLALGTASASADDVVNPDGTVTHRSKLESTCGTSLARFCPALSDTPGQTRNQVICLKPYRNSLTPWCRAAVNAALK